MSLLDRANTYHSLRLGKETWEAESPDRRSRALTEATDYLEQVTGSTQIHEWAIFEQALYMMGSEYTNSLNGISGVGLSGLSVSYSSRTVPPGVSPRAWKVLLGTNRTTGSTASPIKGGRIR